MDDALEGMETALMDWVTAAITQSTDEGSPLQDLCLAILEVRFKKWASGVVVLAALAGDNAGLLVLAEASKFAARIMGDAECAVPV